MTEPKVEVKTTEERRWQRLVLLQCIFVIWMLLLSYGFMHVFVLLGALVA